jgi:hydrogenase maturation protease
VTKTLVAGIGNIFLGDDGFGVAVTARLAQEPLSEGVRVMDIGIRARDLAYELLDGGYDAAILIDAVARGCAPGSVYLIEHESAQETARGAVMMADGHAMTPDAVLTLVRQLGGNPPRILIVGCEPADVEEGIGLSEPVAAAVDEAVAVVRRLVCV